MTRRRKRWVFDVDEDLAARVDALAVLIPVSRRKLVESALEAYLPLVEERVLDDNGR